MSLHLIYGLGVKLIPLVVKAGLAILGFTSHGACAAPAPPDFCGSLMAFCPATHALNGVLTLLSVTLQTALPCADSSSLIAWSTRVTQFRASVLGSTDSLSFRASPAGQACTSAFSLLLSFLHSAFLHNLLMPL
jgi:hypothetical protein